MTQLSRLLIAGLSALALALALALPLACVALTAQSEDLLPVISAADSGTGSSRPPASAILAQLEFPVGRRVAYQERQMNPMLKQPVDQHGFVEITAAGDLVMQVTKPRLERRRLNNGTLSLQRPSRRALRSNPEQALESAPVRTLTLNPKHSGHLVLLTIIQVLEGDVAALQENFDIRSYSSTADSTVDGAWSLRLQPKDPKVQKRLLRIDLAGVNQQLFSLHTQRSEQAWQRITFDAVTP